MDHVSHPKNKFAKLGDAIAISNLKLSMTDSLTGVGASLLDVLRDE